MPQQPWTASPKAAMLYGPASYPPWAYAAIPTQGWPSMNPPIGYNSPASSYAPAPDAEGIADTGLATGRHRPQEDDKPVPVTDLLIDPITRKKYRIDSPFDDELLRLSPLEKAKLGLKNTFVTIPATIYQGLRGDGHFTFSDHLNITSIPYYLGGAFLAVGARFGRDNLNFARQGVGVLMYYLGVMAANKGINAFYKYKSGVDLDLRFKKNNGDIEKVYASADFPRFDLLEEQDYKLMRRKMRIPDNIADSKREVNDEARTIISASRADKLILGNLLAALGAGYLARSDGWARLPDGLKSMVDIWRPRNQEGGCLTQRLTRTGQAIRGTFGPPLREMLLGYPGEKNPLWRKGLLGGSAAFTGLILLHSWIATNRNQGRQYESPFTSNLSPALSPEQSAYTAAIQTRLPGGAVSKLPRKGVFEVVQQIETGPNGLNAGGQT